VTIRNWLSAVAVSAGVLGAAGSGIAADTKDGPAKALSPFGAMKALSAEASKAKAAAYLKAAGKYDAAAFDAIWAKESKSVLDRTADSLALSSTEVAAALSDARKADTPAPTAVPGFLKDPKADAFFRANVAAAYAKALAGKRVYEEALAALKAVQPEQVVEPASYYFYRAVAEHALIQRDDATASIVRLIEDVADAPDRYKMVATLMFFDIQNWAREEKDLANIGRLMDNSGRRLDLARGGPETQGIQKKIVFRLDEVIKDLENQMKPGNCNGGNCPNGGNMPGKGSLNPSSPAPDSVIMGGSGNGKIDNKKLREYAATWGTLPEKERQKVKAEITKSVPEKYRPMVEEYFKSLNKVYGTGDK
jgi:hypothetical protein